jgi:hypothetical protein
MEMFLVGELKSGFAISFSRDDPWKVSGKYGDTILVFGKYGDTILVFK